MKLWVLVIVFMLGCTSSRCINSDSYKAFKNLFNEEKLALDKSGDKEFKLNLLLPEMCKHISKHKKFLFIEEVANFGQTKKGLLFIYDTNELFYFSQAPNRRFKLKKGSGNYLPLQKIANVIKSDFNKESNRLKELFEKRNMNDAPILQLVLLDLNQKESTQVFEFTYSPNFVLENF